MDELAVIGGGPAGLRVAELASARGMEVHLYDQMRSVGRKFLVAGKSGLNLTNAIERDAFLAVYKGTDLPTDLWAEMYDAFPNTALRDWAQGLEQETFVSSGNKVFPRSMKAAPLLRRWVQRLRDTGVQFHLQHRLEELQPLVAGGATLRYRTGDGELIERPARRVVMALGGGSWPQTGSDGGWCALLAQHGVPIQPLAAANCGWQVDWQSDFLTHYEGTPWKNVLCTAGDESILGELVITRYGLEGGPIYKLGHALRHASPPVMQLDFKPSFTVDALVRKAESVRNNLALALSQRWKLAPSIIHLLAQRHEALFTGGKVTLADIRVIAESVKHFPLPLTGPRPISEVISSAGGVRWEGVGTDLQLKALPGIYICGEMLDWEAPTGGFLLQGCMTTATWTAAQITTNHS